MINENEGNERNEGICNRKDEIVKNQRKILIDNLAMTEKNSKTKIPDNRIKTAKYDA